MKSKFSSASASASASASGWFACILRCMYKFSNQASPLLHAIEMHQHAPIRLSTSTILFLFLGVQHREVLDDKRYSSTFTYLPMLA